MECDFVVLGGGIAGLTAARELLLRGHRVVVIEKGTEVGGLARTIEHDGFRFDIGGHRFHSNNPSVVQWVKDLLGNDLLTVPRISHIHLEGKFAKYPLVFPGALSIFSPLKGAKMAASYVTGKITERNRPDVSFEDWVIRRYGKALYDVFFKPYTEKVWGIECHELSAQWAAQRIGIPSMFRAVKHMFSPPANTLATAICEFYYPRVGFGMIPQALEREILKLGGIIHTGTSLMKYVPREDGATVTVNRHDGLLELIETDHVVSTLPLNYLLAALPEEMGSREVARDAQLEYRDMIVLMIALNRKQVSGDSWTYFPSKNLTFGRTHEPKNWSREMVPSDDTTSLAVEIFSSRGEPLWEMEDQAILNKVVGEMSNIGWINAKDVRDSWVLRVPYAYPVYRVGYEAKLTRVKEYLSQWKHLHLVGRTGAFRYMNSDGVVEDVFRFLDEVSAESGAKVEPLAVQAGRWM